MLVVTCYLVTKYVNSTDSRSLGCQGSYILNYPLVTQFVHNKLWITISRQDSVLILLFLYRIILASTSLLKLKINIIQRFI